MFRVVFVFSFLVADVLLVELPPYIKVCKRDQATINDCVKESLDALRPHLISGMPEINVPSLDPFHINEVVAISGDLAPLGASARDVKISSASDFTLKSVDVNLDTYVIRARVLFPKIHLEGNYKMDAQVLLIPLKGQGNFYADAYKCDAEIEIQCEIYQREGVDYMRLKTMEINIDLKDYQIHLTGLFNGDKVLEQVANDALNQNRGELLKAMKPYVEKTVSKVLLDTANKIVYSLPADDLLPKP